ncbi:MAG: nitrogenase component 1 [Methanomicrobiales archaeon]|nr:nitrogenase component 1 [Methanomicrobiales archaeon]
MEGCTVLGALSVTAGVRDALTIVHGPSGCAHHNFSLLHATLQQDEVQRVPRVVSTDLTEDDIIFGGEGALEDTIRNAQKEDISGIFVLTTCIVDTIGDDAAALCRKTWEVPVVHIPAAGFLGGGFNRGMHNALLALAERGRKQEKIVGAVNLIGEKNLEYEVDENFAEISRLLGNLGATIHLRFIRDVTMSELEEVSRSSLNILREPEITPLGNHLERRFRTPFVDRFPQGFSGTLSFLTDVSLFLGFDSEEIQNEEAERQEKIRESFGDIAGLEVSFGDHPQTSFLTEMAGLLDFRIGREGIALPVPVPEPVGTKGVERLFHQWRRTIRAAL